MQGDALWQQLRSGCPSRDFDLLQRISFDSPEAFWPHVLKYLRIKFHRLPYRCLAALPSIAALRVGYCCHRPATGNLAARSRSLASVMWY